MNNYSQKFINFLLIIIVGLQIFIYYYNITPASKVFNQKNISVENFSSMVLSKSGMTKIGSQKLKKIDEYNIFLEGSSYLENKEYKIYGSNISINFKNEISSSEDKVEVVNSMGILNANGFKNIDSEGKIYFKGMITFITHD